MKTITRTILGSALQTAKFQGLPHVIVPNSTLNEKFDILANDKPASNVYPDTKYFCIGLGGHRTQIGADSIPYISPIQHRASDLALFKHLPFVLRELNNDLTAVQRDKYCLRKLVTHNGRNYVAYYGKRLDQSNTDVDMKRTVNNNGVSTTQPFVPTSANLNPPQPEISPTGVVTTSGDYLSVASVVPIIFNANDVLELLNVARVLYDNEEMAVISEIALCAGVDKTAQGQGTGNTVFNYKEVIGCQVVSHMTTYYPMSFLNDGFETQIELGATEPLIGVNTASVVTAP